MSETEDTIPIGKPEQVVGNQGEAPSNTEPDRLVDGGAINISAALSPNGTVIVVSWNAPDGNVSLIRYDTGEGIVTTLLDGSAPGYSPYDDGNLEVEHSYQYILTTLSDDVQYYSNAVTAPSSQKIYPDPIDPAPINLAPIDPGLEVEAAIVHISAGLGRIASEKFVIGVTWYAPAGNNTLTRIDRTTGVVTPIPPPIYSPYIDRNVQLGNVYQYILTHDGQQYYSNLVRVPLFPFGPGPLPINPGPIGPEPFAEKKSPEGA